MIVIEEHEIMVNWFPAGLPEGTQIIPIENGFTSDNVGLVYLQYYIDNSDCGPEADWKLMLMDNHGSHCTPEFIRLANENHICLYLFISYLTHCMQPLDVGVFQPYKHWHDMAIQESLMEFNTEYALSQFFGDLTKIRDNTFKRTTIQHAFKKSGMWPLNAARCIKKLKTYRPDIERKPETIITSEPALLSPRVQPTTTAEVDIGFQTWKEKIQRKMPWSDPIEPEEFNSFVECTQKVCVQSTLKDV